MLQRLLDKRLCLFVLLVGMAACLVGAAAGASAYAVNGSGTSGPPVVTFDADNELLASSGAVDATSFPLGGTVSFDVADGSTAVAIEVPTSGEEAVALLPDGGAAVTYPPPRPVDVGPPATDAVDSTAADAATQAAEAAAADQAPDTDTDPADVPNDAPDPTNYPGGDSTAPPIDGMSIVDDAAGDAGSSMIAATLEPPVAVDADGNLVAATLTSAPGGFDLSIDSPEQVAFPVKVTLTAGFNGEFDPATDASNGEPTANATQLPCGATRADVVVSYVTEWKDLAAALVQDPTACATYHVLVPAAQGVIPRANSAGLVALDTEVPAVTAVGAVFEPVALLHYSSIPAASDYKEVGKTFTRRLLNRGYTRWAIDEAPSDLLKGSDNPSWKNFTQLVAGLSAPVKGLSVTGIIEDAYERADTGLEALKKYKSGAKTLLDSKPGATDFDWTAVLNGTLLWAQETYTKCSMVCRNGATLRAMAAHTNAYTQHFARLAFASDAPSTVSPARAALNGRYLPLTNEWKGGDDPAYGTALLGLKQMQELAQLQIYAARSWQTSDNPYSGPRIGISWTDDTVDFPKSKRRMLANAIAKSLEGAYEPDGSALGACTARGTISKVFCLPQAGGHFTNNWSIFRTWGRRTQSTSGCPAAGGIDLTGGPDNDNLDGATMLDSGTASGSADGVLAGATVQDGEQTAPDQQAPLGTVWYCWTASQAAIDADICFPGGEEFVVQPMRDGQIDNSTSDTLSIWSGNVFGSLQLVADGAGGVPFYPVVGQTYMLQIGSRNTIDPAPDFRLTWPLQCA